MKNICIMGLGNMGQAIFDTLKDDYEIVTCLRDDDVNEKVKSCDVLLIAVKPQDFYDLAGDFTVDLDGKLIISIMAGVSTEKISLLLGAQKVVRVMPNLPLKVGAGISGWYANKNVSDDEKSFIKDIFGRMGTEISVDEEDKINKITALSGGGPAYYYYLNRALRMKAEELGFNEEDARKIVGGTLQGAAKLLKETGECSGKIISRIACKGGTTEAALMRLDSEGVEQTIMDAVEAAYKRAQELNED